MICTPHSVLTMTWSQTCLPWERGWNRWIGKRIRTGCLSFGYIVRLKSMQVKQVLCQGRGVVFWAVTSEQNCCNRNSRSNCAFRASERGRQATDELNILGNSFTRSVISASFCCAPLLRLVGSIWDLRDSLCALKTSVRLKRNAIQINHSLLYSINYWKVTVMLPTSSSAYVRYQQNKLGEQIQSLLCLRCSLSKVIYLISRKPHSICSSPLTFRYRGCEGSARFIPFLLRLTCSRSEDGCSLTMD